MIININMNTNINTKYEYEYLILLGGRKSMRELSEDLHRAPSA